MRPADGDPPVYIPPRAGWAGPKVGGEVRRGAGIDPPVIPGGSAAAPTRRVDVVERRVPVESKLTRVARVFAIVRDVMVILVLALAIILGSSVMSRVGRAGQMAPNPDPGPPCVMPSTDQWGTFCPETPGGG